MRFLGKKEVFDAPVVGQLAKAMGGIRVERGTGSDEPLAEAALALEAGEMVAMMPQGTIPRGKAFFDPVLKGRWGAARLAAMTGAPVIPVGLWGTEKVWPRSERLPNVLALRNPPHGHDPRRAARRGAHRRVPDADTKKIMKAITALLPPEARKKRTPTDEELAKTYPGGKVKDTDETPPGRLTREPTATRRRHGRGSELSRQLLLADDVEGAAGPEPLDLLVAEGVVALEVDRRCRRACGSCTAPACRARGRPGRGR